MARLNELIVLALAVAATSTAVGEGTAGKAAAHATAHTKVHSKVTPVQKVIEMLENMEVKGKEMLHEEKLAYATTETWCSTEAEQLNKQITECKAECEDLKADIAKGSSTSTELGEAIAELETKIAETEAELKSASSERKAENEEFKVSLADVSESIDAVGRAIGTLKEKNAEVAQTSLLQITQSRFLEPGSKSLIQAFLALKSGNSGLEMAPEANAYEFQSGGIVGMLEKLAIKFKDQKDALEKDEMRKRNGFETLAQTLTDDIEAMKDTLAKKTSQKAAADESVAIAKSSMARSMESMKSDMKGLKDLLAECRVKGTEYATNQGTRKNEIAAISKAIDIIKSDEVSGNAEKHIRASAMIQEGSTSLAHLRKKVLKARSDPEDVAQRVASLLDTRARKLHSRVLELVAVRSKYDPLGKVRTMMKALIRKLMDEANAEQDEHAYCVKELHANTLTRKQKTEEIEQLSARKDKKTAQYHQLRDEIEELGKDIDAISEAQKEAMKIRSKDKTRNLAAIEDAKEGQEAVSRAMTVLKDFYEPGESAASLLQGTAQSQTKVISDEMDKVASKAPYSGMSGEGSSVIAMLDVILSDFARLESETQTSEDTDAEAHTVYMEESNDEIALKEAQVEHLKDKNDEIAGKIKYLGNMLDGVQDELDKADKYYEVLKERCIDTGLSYEERKTKRAEEIRSLKEALEVLDTEELTEIDTTTGTNPASLTR